jgi:Ser/Thr protein kinase RdoA (MazF antagonist)
MKPFLESSRRSRLHRLRKLAKVAIYAYGMGDAHLELIKYGENIIYRVDLPSVNKASSESSPYFPNRYVLRIHAMGDQEAIASEFTWLMALSQEAGLTVPAPVPTPDGRLLVTINTPGIPNGRVVSLMRWLEGRRIHRDFHPQHLSALGKAVAAMHNFSAGWKPPAGFARPVWDWDSLLGGSFFNHPLDELLHSLPTNIQEPFQQISSDIRQTMDSLGKGVDAFGLIHADLYPENVLFKGREAYLIDFEDCGYGCWMWDIAVALCSWAWGDDWEHMRDAFREGYDLVRVLPEAQWDQLDLFVATQFATIVIWSTEFLALDPKRVAEYVPWRNDNAEKLIRYFDRQR